MSKNAQRNQSEINLGNETYDRGYSDGAAGNPKTIKKTHRHAHRYHIGYRHGADATKRSTGNPLVVVSGNVAHVHHKLRADHTLAGNPRNVGLLTRIWNWIKT